MKRKGKKSQGFLAFHNKNHFRSTVRMKGMKKRKTDEIPVTLLKGRNTGITKRTVVQKVGKDYKS